MLNRFNPSHWQACPSAITQAPVFDGLSPIRQWLNGLEIRNATLAHLICRIIPVQCPFERDICLFGCISIHIPPLCKLNPLYEEVVALRFRSLCYLADECKQDVRCYC
jgi:hypothetical protein